MFGIQSSCMLCPLSSTTSLWGCPERGRIPPSHMLCSLLNPSTPALMAYGPQNTLQVSFGVSTRQGPSPPPPCLSQWLYPKTENVGISSSRPKQCLYQMFDHSINHVFIQSFIPFIDQWKSLEGAFWS